MEEKNYVMRLRGKHILEMSRRGNTNKLALQSKIAASTARRYIDTPEIVKAFDLSTLLKILLDGCHLTIEQVLAMKLGDVFEVIETDEE